MRFLPNAFRQRLFAYLLIIAAKHVCGNMNKLKMKILFDDEEEFWMRTIGLRSSIATISPTKRRTKSPTRE